LAGGELDRAGGLPSIERRCARQDHTDQKSYPADEKGGKSIGWIWIAVRDIFS
jgi:hypothetical protein